MIWPTFGSSQGSQNLSITSGMWRRIIQTSELPPAKQLPQMLSTASQWHRTRTSWHLPPKGCPAAPPQTAAKPGRMQHTHGNSAHETWGWRPQKRRNEGQCTHKNPLVTIRSFNTSSISRFKSPQYHLTSRGYTPEKTLHHRNHQAQERLRSTQLWAGTTLYR